MKSDNTDTYENKQRTANQRPVRVWPLIGHICRVFNER